MGKPKSPELDVKPRLKPWSLPDSLDVSHHGLAHLPSKSIHTLIDSCFSCPKKRESICSSLGEWDSAGSFPKLLHLVLVSPRDFTAPSARRLRREGLRFSSECSANPAKIGSRGVRLGYLGVSWGILGLKDLLLDILHSLSVMSVCSLGLKVGLVARSRAQCNQSSGVLSSTPCPLISPTHMLSQVSQVSYQYETPETSSEMFTCVHPSHRRTCSAFIHAREFTRRFKRVVLTSRIHTAGPRVAHQDQSCPRLRTSSLSRRSNAWTARRPVPIRGME